MKQHKWHKEIKAWADGAEIEQIYTYANLKFDNWERVKYPCWYEDDAQFRIKPQPKEPQYLYAYYMNGEIKWVKGGQIVEGKYATYIGKIPLIVENNDDL